MDNFDLNKSSQKEQIKDIIDSPNAAYLAQSIPAEELLLSIKRASIEDSLQLIELLSSEQVRTIIDLDAWKFDQIDPNALNLWLAALAQANPVTALEQMRSADIELLTLILRNCAQIHDLIEEENPLVKSDLVLITTDRHYLLEFKTDQEYEVQSRFMKNFIDDLMGRDFLYAIRLIESARFETESILQEDALRLRDGRLQDLGFLPLGESLSILSYVDIEKAKTTNFIIEEKKTDERKPVRISRPIPSLNELTFLKEALTGQSRTTLENSWSYIVTVTNRVHMAFNGKYSDVTAVNESAKYTLNVIEMALSFLSEGKLSSAKQTFLSYTPQDLFKIGHSLILRLNRDFQKLLSHPAFALLKSSPLRLDSPLREVVRGTIQPEPLFYEGLIDPKSVSFRTFKNLSDLALSKRAISEAAFRCALLGQEALGFVEDIEQKKKKNVVAFGVLLGTYFAHLILKGKGSFDVLSQKELHSFFTRFEKSSSSRAMSADDRDKCISHIKERSRSLIGLLGMTSEEAVQERAKSYANVVIGLIESEFAHITAESPDPAIINCLLVET